MQRIAGWNSVRDVWETDQVDLLSGRSVVFSETFTISGSMRNGVVYALPTSVPLMDGSGSLFSQLGGKLIPTPRASDGEKGGPNQRGSKGDLTVSSAVARLLPSPVAQPSGNTPDTMPEAPNARIQHRDGPQGLGNQALSLLPTPMTVNTTSERAKTGRSSSGKSRGGPSFGLEDVALLLPSPVAQPSGNSPEDHLRKKPGREVVTDLAVIVENDLLKTGGRLLPTPNTMEHLPARTGEARERQLRRGEGSDASRRQSMGNLREDIVEIEPGAWGPYAAAIQRWEQILGRPAPDPTEVGPKGGRRLSSVFVEWLMGVPDGWVTDPTLGLSRVQQLRALGNGVVTQQAVAALRAARSINEGERSES